MTPQQIFTQDLRRILYLSQILRANVESIKSLSVCPTYLKSDLNNLSNCIGRLFLQISSKAKPEQWDEVMKDLTGEDIQDISLMLDFLAGIRNVGELLTVLEEHVKIGQNGQ